MSGRPWHMETLPDGDAGTRRTLERMVELVRESVADPVVRGTAEQLARSVGARDTLALIQAVRQYLAERVHFVADPLGVEMVRAPESLLREIEHRFYTVGDCDDVSVLGAALLGAIGIPSRFVVLGFFHPDAPMGHVYAEAFDGAVWRELDTTRTMPEIGRRDAISRQWIVPVFE